MKKFSMFLVLVAIATFSFVKPPVKVPADLTSSFVKWTGYKVTGQHFGKVMLKSGSLEFEGDNLIGGAFEMDMTSITVEDLSGEGAKKLGGHLKSDDFFGVAAHPTSKFVITKVVSRGTPGAYKIIGNLNLKAATKELRFNADIKTIEGKQTAVAKIKLDRSEYDIRYGSGSFFENLGDKTIYDEFDLEINLVYKK
jgi:polyisoprenoid-binding protein YceI